VAKNEKKNFCDQIKICIMSVNQVKINKYHNWMKNRSF